MVPYNHGMKSKVFSPSNKELKNLDRFQCPIFIRLNYTIKQSPKISCCHQVPLSLLMLFSLPIHLPCSMKCSHPWRINPKVVEWNHPGLTFQDRIHLNLLWAPKATFHISIPKQSPHRGCLPCTSLPIPLKCDLFKERRHDLLIFICLCQAQRRNYRQAMGSKWQIWKVFTDCHVTYFHIAKPNAKIDIKPHLQSLFSPSENSSIPWKGQLALNHEAWAGLAKQNDTTVGQMFLKHPLPIPLPALLCGQGKAAARISKKGKCCYSQSNVHFPQFYWIDSKVLMCIWVH